MPDSVSGPAGTSSALLSSVIKHYSDIASGDNAKLESSIAPIIGDVTKQRQNQDQQILANTPRGGVQQLAMQENEQNAAAQIGKAKNEAFNSAFPELEKLAGTEFGISQAQLQNILAAYGGAGQAYGLAGQELGGAESAYSGAANSLTGAAKINQGVLDTQAQQKGAMMGLIGSLVGAGGTIGAAAMGKPPVSCWVAAAIYGDLTSQFFAARRFIFQRWKGPIANITKKIYLRFGERLANVVRGSASLKFALKPLFDLAVERGR